MKDISELNGMLNSFRLPLYSEIPDVGLYLEQVAKYINGYLEPFGQMKVTPSMISNYAKQKLFQRVNKKTYTRDQIAVIMFIVLTKTVLPIEKIRILLNRFNESGSSIEETYTSYARALENMLGSFSEPEKMKDLPAGSQNKMMQRNIVIAIAHKMYLECYFDIFEEPDADA